MKDGLPPTDKQLDLIAAMNEFCREKCPITIHLDRKQASDYISDNIQEYILLTLDDWSLQYL